jgi:hypothetical protein
MTRDEWKEWLAESWDEAQARAHTPDDIKKIKSRWEPVAYTTGFYNGHCVIEPIDRVTVLPVDTALYRAPTEWVGLTDEEVSEIIDREIGFNSCWGPEEKFARAIEQALKEKNT